MPGLRSLASVLSLVMAALALMGCASSPDSNAEPTPVHRPIGEWRLESIGGSPIESILPVDLPPPDLRIHEDGRVSGFAGVNRFMSTVDLDLLPKGQFQLRQPVAATKMAGPPEAMALEQRFLEALGEAAAFTADGDRLTVTGSGAVLSFSAVP